MDLATAFTNVNWLSVLVAALSAFALGSLWYTPILFGKTWQRLINLTDDDIKNANMGLIFGTTFVLNIIGALFLDLFLGPDATLASGFAAGFIVGFFWVATSIAINYLYGRKPIKLFLIDGGYFALFYTLEGIILGAW